MSRTEQIDCAERVFGARLAEGDAAAAAYAAGRWAALLGADYTEQGVAPRVPPAELDEQIGCAERILARRRREGDAPAARYTLRVLALLMAKRGAR